MKKYFTILLYFLLAGVVSGQVIQVNQSSGCLSSFDSYYSSIADAVSSSSNGSTVVVCPGTYMADNVTIDKPLKIYGYKHGTAVVNLSALGYSNYIGITSNDVEIKNLTIVTPVNVEAFHIRGKNITIENVTIDSGFWYGFYIEGSEDVTIKGVYVYEAEKAAVEIHDSSNITVEGSTFIQKSTTSNLYNEKYIALYNVSNSTIGNNRIYDVITDASNKYDSGFAIYINSSSTGNNVTGNFIRHAGYCIYFEDNSSGNIFYNNYFDCGRPPCRDDQGGYNYYNISKTLGTNIVGGNYIQGNYWGGELPYEGNDTSNPKDGIGDTDLPYNANASLYGGGTYILNGGDWGPLIKQHETSPPVIFSINLQPNYELSACTVLNASVTSYNETITGCTLYLDNQTLAMNLSQGSYISYCTYRLCPADFPIGYHLYYIEAEDLSNNTGTSDIRGLNINATPAVITIISPANNAAYNTTNIALEVTSDKSITAWLYNLNGTNVSFTPNTTITAQEGNNTLEVYALDIAGYWVYSIVNFTVDLVPPAIQVFSPVNGTLYTSSNVTINATANESVTWHISLNGNTTQNVTLPLNITANEGVNHLIIYATDIAGNINSSDVYFTVDTTPPYAIPSTTGNTKVDINSSYNLSWTLYDNVAGGYYRVLRNGSLEEGWQPWSNASDITVPVNTTQLGTYNYTIEFNDSAGWAAIDEVIITVVDPNPPNITIISPANNSYYREITILVNATSDRVVHTWLYSINGSANESFSKHLTDAIEENINITSGDGYYLLEIWANSTAGNLSRAMVYFYVDTAPPVTTDDSPAGWQNSDFVVNLTAQDNLSGVAYTSYRLDNQSWMNGTMVNITTEGNHTITYYSVDRAGNVEVVKKTYAALDKTPPVVNITSPLNMTYTTSEVPLNVTASEAIFNWTYSLNNASNTTFTPNSTITAQEGINHIVVYALDRAGNINHDEIYFTVDTTPPGAVSNLTATPGVQSILLSWVNPDDRDFAGVEVWVNGELNATLNFTFTSFKIESLIPATAYNVSLRTFDGVGNRGNWSNITVTTLPEEKQTSSPSGGGGETNKNRIEKIIKEANKGRYTNVTIEKRDIEEIAVKPRVDLYYAKITVEFLDELPEYIGKPPTDKIYMIFKVDLSTKAIEKAKIKFKVKKEWLKENDINPGKVKLLHYHAATWEESPARKVGEDGSYYLYEAEVEAFSYFVVTGEEGYIEENAEVKPEKERRFDDFPVFDFPLGMDTQGVEEGGSADIKDKPEVRDNKTVPEQESEIQVYNENRKSICGPGLVILIPLIPLLILRKAFKK